MRGRLLDGEDVPPVEPIDHRPLALERQGIESYRPWSAERRLRARSHGRARGVGWSSRARAGKIESATSQKWRQIFSPNVAQNAVS